MNENFMKERPVLPLILSMSLPMVLSMLVNSLYNIVDSYFVAKISEDAMTALSLVYPVQNFINAVGIGFGIGINALIAFRLGSGDRRGADAAASQGMLLSLLHGMAMMIGSIAVIRSFLSMFTGSEEIVSLGVRYSSVAFSFTIIITLGVTFEKIFQAVGRMKVTMAALMLGCIANIILDPLMIFGIGPFPAMGIEGAALATGIGQTLTLALYIFVYIKRPLSVKINTRDMKITKGTAPRLYAVGIPAALNIALPSLLISALNAILAAFSEVYILVLGIYYKLQTFLYLPSNGFIQGMRPVIGFNYGAGENERVGKIYSTVLIMCAAIMALGTAVCLVFPGELIGMFTQNGDTIAAGETALKIICAGFLISSVSVVSSGALEGLGKGVPSLVISLCRYAVIIIPAAAVLAKLIGPAGVWHAFWISELITAAAAFPVYRRARK